jgi:S-adenosylmethionine hydrolase
VKEKTVLQVVELTNPKYFLSPVSSTFHGRDIFAPVAAHLAIGVPLADFGEPVETIQELKLSLPFLEGMTLKAEVLYIDRFGNAITNVSQEILETMQTELQTEQMEVRIKETRIRGIAGSYRDILQGEEVSSANHKNPLGIICNSLNLLEFFVYRGNAQTEYEIEVGVPVEILFL